MKIKPEVWVSIFLAGSGGILWVVQNINTLNAASGTNDRDIKEIKETVNLINEKSEKIQIDLSIIKSKIKE